MAAFVWGDGGTQLTPEAIARQRLVAQAMVDKGSDFSPIQSPWQGAARVTQAIIGAGMAHDANQSERMNATADKELIGRLMAGGAAPAATAASVSAEPMAKPPTPNVDEPWMGTPPAPPPMKMDDAIAGAASRSGVQPQYLTRLAMLESGGDPSATSKLSSAQGPFQFIKSTARQYGLDNPSDTGASADAAARLTLDNKAALTKALGREPTDGELYLAHQQGAGGASKLLANPDAPAVSIVGRDAVLNNGGTPDMTAGQFAQKWAGRFDRAPQTAPTSPAANPVAPQAAIPPAMIEALSSPYVSEGTKRIALLMLQQQQANAKVSTVDLGNAVGIMDARGNIVRQIAKGEPNKSANFGKIGTDANGNDIMGWTDPRTLAVTEYKQPAAAPAQGATAQPAIPPAPPGVNPKLWRDEQTRIAADAAAGKLTETQANATQFANRMEDAERNLALVEPEVAAGGWGITKDRMLRGVTEGQYNPVPRGATNWGVSDTFQKYDQAKSQFITAQLRKESGAAISPSEFDRYDKEFFPQAGDSAELVKQKQQARKVAVEAMKKGAGPGYKSPASPSSGAAASAAPTGVDPKVWAAMTPEERALWK
jgi:hypothetical protein